MCRMAQEIFAPRAPFPVNTPLVTRLYPADVHIYDTLQAVGCSVSYVSLSTVFVLFIFTSIDLEVN